MKKIFSLLSLVLLLCSGIGYATDVPPITSPYPNHVALGEADDTLTSPVMVERQVWPFVAPADKTLFKEIVPCRLYDSRTVPTVLAPNNSYNFFFTGPSMDPLNDCYGKIPSSGVVALTLQLTSYNDGKQVGYLTVGNDYVSKNDPGTTKLFSVLQNVFAFLYRSEERR